MNQTAISDEGLAALGSFPRLKFVSLTDTAVSENGLEVLALRLPELQVEAGHLPPLEEMAAFKDATVNAHL